MCAVAGISATLPSGNTTMPISKHSCVSYVTSKQEANADQASYPIVQCSESTYNGTRRSRNKKHASELKQEERSDIGMETTEYWIRPGKRKVIALLHGIGAKDP